MAMETKNASEVADLMPARRKMSFTLRTWPARRRRANYGDGNLSPRLGARSLFALGASSSRSRAG